MGCTASGEISPPQKRSSDEEQKIRAWAQGQCDKHTELRALHGCGPVELDDQLCIDAQAWAERILKKNSLTHADWEQRKHCGENLFMSDGVGTMEVLDDTATQCWYDEIANYNFEDGTCKNDGMIGHFTQIVWKKCTKVGFGYAAGENGTYICARYNPAGNISGNSGHNHYVENVPPLV